MVSVAGRVVKSLHTTGFETEEKEIFDAAEHATHFGSANVASSTLSKSLKSVVSDSRNR